MRSLVCPATRELSAVEKSVHALERRLNGQHAEVGAALKQLAAGQKRLADALAGQQ